MCADYIHRGTCETLWINFFKIQDPDSIKINVDLNLTQLCISRSPNFSLAEFDCSMTRWRRPINSHVGERRPGAVPSVWGHYHPAILYSNTASLTLRQSEVVASDTSLPRKHFVAPSLLMHFKNTRSRRTSLEPEL